MAASPGIAEAERIPQTWVVGDVEHCVNELAAFIDEYGLTDIVTWAVPPGLHARPDQCQPRALRARGGAAAQGDV